MIRERHSSFMNTTAQAARRSIFRILHQHLNSFPVGVRRIDTPEEEAEPALYEFYNVFPAGTLKAGNYYDVTVQAYDRKGEAVSGEECKFTLKG